ncbi:GCN5-related N-acetyltransferase [Crinalium epipsammum PCC 9333]|uniref:GCN5-related N-acetyltransferase n=1 Tax=Crinalium epipsammum PCC 9333 TaxID=1173022 RepID=K9W0K6_9CYAN|nr:GNAT family N-acetyltransferase [Crinalium epipsammum]AFZ13746.1 GCN5-related N-acetyltransferase [Crinalium epipsammum PCC 9333]
MSELIIKIAELPLEFPAIKKIRKAVFQLEQGIDSTLDFDGEDEKHEHILAYLDDQPVGTARIKYLDNKTAKIERLAVLSEVRGQGIAKKIMASALDFLTQKGFIKVLIHAQEYVKGLHEKLGFEQVGEIFEEAGIPHVKMIKMIE